MFIIKPDVGWLRGNQVESILTLAGPIKTFYMLLALPGFFLFGLGCRASGHFFYSYH